MPVHTVAQGECVSSIADKEGFFWESIWQHDRNKSIRQKRKNPNALQPGDQLFIPDIRKREESCSTAQRHRFQLKGVPVRFNVQVLNEQGEPRAGVPFVLDIDGKVTRGEIPADGNLSEIIKPNAKLAKLTLNPPDGIKETYELQLGFMNPVDDIAGAKGRLKNLGYYKGAITASMDEETAEAIRQFQERTGLAITGEIDGPTQAALEQNHGGG
jgi:hypothetical protein